MGAPRALALCHNFSGALDFQRGEWQSAEASLRAAVSMYRELGSAAGESLSLQRLGLLLTARGQLDEACETLSDGLVVAERAAMRSHCLTRLHASMIRNRMAARDGEGLAVSLAEGTEAARRHGNCVTCNALLLPELVRALIELGRLAEAGDTCAQLQGIAAEFDSRVWDAMASQCLGRVCLARGHHAQAIVALDRAAAAYERAGQPYELARCLALKAEAQRAAGAAGAAESAARASALLSALGAPGLE